MSPATVVTRKTDYATRLLLHLARRPRGDWTTSREIAEIQGIPERLVGNIVSQLTRSGLVASKRGKGGGIRLGMPSSQISLHDVLCVMQGPISLNTCLSDMVSCELADNCPMREPWARSQRLLVDQLRATTFEELTMEEHSALEL